MALVADTCDEKVDKIATFSVIIFSVWNSYCQFSFVYFANDGFFVKKVCFEPNLNENRALITSKIRKTF